MQPMSKKRTFFFFVPMLAVTLLCSLLAAVPLYFADLELSYNLLLAAQFFMVLQGFTLTAFLTALIVFHRAPGDGHIVPPVAMCMIAAGLCSVLMFTVGVLGAVKLDAALIFGAAVLAETFIGSLLGYLLANALRASKKKKKR